VKKLKLWSGLLVLFLSGIVIGAMGTWIIVENKAVDSLTRGRPDIPGIIIKKLTRELDLDETQKERITKIVCRAYQELLELRKRHAPEKKEILERSRSMIKAELSPEQQKKLDAFHERKEKHRARRGGGARGDDGDVDPCK
jgi:hypothetical protein